MSTVFDRCFYFLKGDNMCKHYNKDLIGEAGLIRCRACGKVFKDFTEIEADRESLPFSEPRETEELPKEIALDSQIEAKIAQTLHIHYVLLSIDEITHYLLSRMLSIAVVLNLYSHQNTLYI